MKTRIGLYRTSAKQNPAALFFRPQILLPLLKWDWNYFSENRMLEADSDQNRKGWKSSTNTIMKLIPHEMSLEIIARRSSLVKKMFCYGIAEWDCRFFKSDT